jgi:hypothetical protein
MADIWSSIITAALENAPADIAAEAFIDFGKTIALSHSGLPVTLLDLDMIVWRPLAITAPVQFFHWEELEEPWYPELGKLSVPDEYRFPLGDWSAPAGNTALLHIADAQFRDRFVAESSAYVRGNRPSAEQTLGAFLFSGQRLITALGRCGSCNVQPFISYCYRVRGESRWIGEEQHPSNPLDPRAFLSGWPYMHLWGSKHAFRADRKAEAAFAQQLIRHAEAVYPRTANRLHKIWDEVSSESA